MPSGAGRGPGLPDRGQDLALSATPAPGHSHGRFGPIRATRRLKRLIRRRHMPSFREPSTGPALGGVGSLREPAFLLDAAAGAILAANRAGWQVWGFDGGPA